MVSDRDHMRHALRLGRRGQGRTAPNPAVGCVLVAEDVVVGRGWTQPGGRPHAEIVALQQAGDRARGATAYVTLEPCSHTGQTGPCADALIAAGVRRVVVAIEDPDPRVSGRGLEKLRGGGLIVETGLCADEALRDLQGFLNHRVSGRPAVTLKLAMTLDGRIATASGESQWITGAEARRVVHGLRAGHDAVMVGGGTARADDPSLTVRGLGLSHQPRRVVVSRKLDLPLDGKLATDGAAPVILLHGKDAAPASRAVWRGQGATLLEVPLSGRQVDLAAGLVALAGEGVTSVFCEGGGQLAASLLSAGMVDRLVVFAAGAALGAEGQPGLGAMGLERLADMPRFQRESLRAVGADVMSVWTPVQVQEPDQATFSSRGSGTIPKA